MYNENMQALQPSVNRLGLRRVWNPDTQYLPVPNSGSGVCTEYWGISEKSMMNDWMLRLRRMTARKIPFVSEADQALRHINMSSMRVLGVLSDQRDERSIVGLDIIGACSYAVRHVPIPDPAALCYKQGASCSPDDPEQSGFYCIEVHALKYRIAPPIPVRTAQGCFVAELSYPFSLWIHSSEWGIWSTLFDCTIAHGYEAAAIEHPLWRVAEKVHQQRMDGTDPNAKALLSSLHTSMGSRWTKDNESITRSIWSTHHMPLAWVRGEWLRQWHRVSEAYPSALLCYANVDSMHWSIDRAEYTKKPFSTSKEWGRWRVEFEGQRGMWLSVGKYWILKDNTVHVYKNAGSSSPWRTKVRHRVDTQKHPGCRAWYSSCIWHGLATTTKLVKKEKDLIQHVLPSFAAVQSEQLVHALQVRSVLKDRRWKKKLWFLMKNAVQ